MGEKYAYGDVYAQDGTLVVSHNGRSLEQSQYTKTIENNKDKEVEMLRGYDYHERARKIKKGMKLTKFGCLERPLKKLFHRYGQFLARHPLPFLICPVILAAILSCGVLFMKLNNDAVQLFTPTNGLSKLEKETFTTVFPPDFMHDNNMFSSTRQTVLGLFGDVIITAKDGGSVLQPHVLEDTVTLDNMIRSFAFNTNNRSLSYKDVCTKWTLGACSESNVILMLTSRQPDLIARMKLTYPVFKMSVPAVHRAPLQSETTVRINLGSVLGGVTLSEKGHILSASAMRSVFTLDDRNQEDGLAWEDEFLEVMKNASFKHIDVTWMISRSVDKELEKSTDDVTAKFTLLFALMINFAIISCVMCDCVLSKPLLGCLGVLTPALAVVSSYGLLMFVGVEFILIATTVPFLVLAIGFDDLFVLLAAWRNSDPRLSIEERTGRTFSDAGVSITITSITDVLGFLIGSASVFPAVRVFCMYTGVAILFDYVYQITFFGACIVYTGRREHANRHSSSCHVVPAASERPDKSWLYKLLCTGGFSFRSTMDVNSPSALAEISKATHWGNIFFRDYYARFLQNTPVKIIGVLTFVGYAAISLWGAVQVREGIQLKHLAVDGSYLGQHFEEANKYFTRYFIDVGVLFNEDVDYSSRTVLADVDSLVFDMENSGYFHGRDVATSWIHDFWDFADRTNMTISRDTFSRTLHTFLIDSTFSSYGYKLDLKLDKNATNPVLASRIYIQSKDIIDSGHEKGMMMAARDIASQPKYAKYNISVFSPMFSFYDQYVMIMPSTAQNLAIVAVCMLVVSLLLIPDPIVSVWVFVSIVSICAGVIGFMTLWDVNLDAIAMINLIISVGFSVDYSAHIAYAFSRTDASDPNARMSSTLASLGLPVAQCASSTLIGVVLLSLSKAYIIRTFFKIMFLVVIFGLMHGLLFLPILLTVTTRRRSDDKCTDSKRQSYFAGEASTLMAEETRPGSENDRGEIVVKVSTV